MDPTMHLGQACGNCGKKPKLRGERNCPYCGHPFGHPATSGDAITSHLGQVCGNCGKKIRLRGERNCPYCGQPLKTGSPALTGDAVDVAQHALESLVVVWSYPGRTQAEAARAYGAHAKELAARGYVPVSQSWAEGRPGVGRVLAIGLFANSIRPAGYLTVTYQLREPASVTSGADPVEQIRRLGELRDQGLITDEEFDAKKADLLSRM